MTYKENPEQEEIQSNADDPEIRKLKHKWYVKMYHHKHQYHRHFAVTALTKEEAESLMAYEMTQGWTLKKVRKIVEDREVQEL